MSVDEIRDFQSRNAACHEYSPPADNEVPTLVPDREPDACDRTSYEYGAQPIDILALYKSAKPSVVQVAGNDVGSGFMVDRVGTACLVATANHLVSNSDQAAIRFNDTDDVRIIPKVAKDPANDLALLEFEPNQAGECKPLGLQAKEPRKGDPVVTLGFPRMSVEMFASPGKILETDGKMKKPPEFGENVDRNVITTEQRTMGGNSGGPLLNAKGEAVGVHVAGGTRTLSFWKGGGTIRIAHDTKIDALNALIEKYKKARAHQPQPMDPAN
ncbi:MAG TPA: serine protease [Candidatus Obscuribacterales bacterium]